MKNSYRIKTNNQELLISKQNEFDATSRWIEFQKTRLLTSNTIGNRISKIRETDMELLGEMQMKEKLSTTTISWLAVRIETRLIGSQERISLEAAYRLDLY